MKNKKLFILIAIIVSVVIITISFFIKNNYKTEKFVNTNIKTTKDLEEYILNISSYEADISLEVISNKNNNKYMIKQKYSSPNIFRQEVIEPENIQGLITSYDGTNLKIENTKLGLNKIFENYQYISENSLNLCDFINDYKNSNNTELEEDKNFVIMKVKVEQNNKYSAYKKLYIDKSTKKPTKMEIEDINKKMLVYILYNEININSINKDEVLAFKLKMEAKNI